MYPHPHRTLIVAILTAAGAVLVGSDIVTGSGNFAPTRPQAESVIPEMTASPLLTSLDHGPLIRWNPHLAAAHFGVPDEYAVRLETALAPVQTEMAAPEAPVRIFSASDSRETLMPLPSVMYEPFSQSTENMTYPPRVLDVIRIPDPEFRTSGSDSDFSWIAAVGWQMPIGILVSLVALLAGMLLLRTELLQAREWNEGRARYHELVRANTPPLTDRLVVLDSLLNLILLRVLLTEEVWIEWGLPYRGSAWDKGSLSERPSLLERIAILKALLSLWVEEPPEVKNTQPDPWNALDRWKVYRRANGQLIVYGILFAVLAFVAITQLVSFIAGLIYPTP